MQDKEKGMLEKKLIQSILRGEISKQEAADSLRELV